MWSMLIYFVDSDSTPDPRLVVGAIALVYRSGEVYGCPAITGILRITLSVETMRKWVVDVGFEWIFERWVEYIRQP